MTPSFAQTIAHESAPEPLHYALVEYDSADASRTNLSQAERAARNTNQSALKELAAAQRVEWHGPYLKGTAAQLQNFSQQLAAESLPVSLRVLTDSDELLLARLYGRNTWEVTQEDYLQQRHLLDMRSFARAIKHNEQQLAQLNATTKGSNKKRIQLERELTVWREVVAHPVERWAYQRPSYLKEYAARVHKAISSGHAVAPEIIAQAPAFATAKTARERYEKGWATSFGNMTAGVDDAMQATRGYKVKRQDGKPISAAQKEEIARGLAEIEAAVGPLGDVLRQGNVTFAHTNGKYPFLSEAGGLYHASERTITMGIASKLTGKPLPAQAHEVGHWLDNEAGTLQGVEIASFSKSFKRQTLNFLSEGDNRSAHENADQGLIKDATATMSRSFEVRRLLKSGGQPKASTEEKILAEIVKVNLGTYWHDPREVWARLFEQYVTTKLGGRVEFAARQDYANLPGYWTQEAFEQLMPRVAAAITRRLDIVRAGVRLATPALASEVGAKQETL